MDIMEDLILTKKQIDRLFVISDQMKYFDDYTVTLHHDGTVSVRFEIPKDFDSKHKFVEEHFR
jgi:hypothetical protein